MVVYVTCNTDRGHHAKIASLPSAVPGDLSEERSTSFFLLSSLTILLYYMMDSQVEKRLQLRLPNLPIHSCGCASVVLNVWLLKSFNNSLHRMCQGSAVRKEELWALIFDVLLSTCELVRS